MEQVRSHLLDRELRGFLNVRVIGVIIVLLIPACNKAIPLVRPCTCSGSLVDLAED